MAEASLKIAVNTQEVEKAIVAMDKFDGVNKSALKTMRDMEYKMMDVGRSVSNVEKVTRQITDTTGKYYNATQQVKDGLIAQAKELDSVAKATGRATVAANDSIKANNGANTSYKGTGGAIRNVSYQVQDFATQVGAGTSAATALGQQLPQLLSGFGLMGVVLGTVTAIIIPLFNSFGFFESKADKASKALDRFSNELANVATLGSEVSKFAKDFTETSADGFVKYVEAYNKASATQRKEMDLWLQTKLLVEQAKLNDIASEAQGRQIDFGAGQSGGEATGTMEFKPELDRQRELAIMYRTQADNVKRLQAAVSGDFGAATAGAKATSEQKSQESLAQSYDRKVAAIRAEAETLQISNVERKLAVELANLEIDKAKLGTAEYLKQKDAITQAVIARNTAEEERKLKSYTDTLSEQNKIIELEGQRTSMTTREYERLVEQKRLNIQLDKETAGMSPIGESNYRKVAQAAFDYQQNLKDANYQQQQTFGGGATAALYKYSQDASNLGSQVGSAFTNAFKGMEDAVVQFTMTGKASFSSFAMSVVADIQRILVKQALMGAGAGGGAMGGLIGLGVSLAGSYFGGSAGGDGSSIDSLTSSYGEAHDIPSYAVGTNYVPNDGLAMIHKGEAIIPAKYNNSGGMGGGVNNVVTVNVSTGGGQDSSTSNNQDASKLGALISNVVKATIIKEQRNGGLLSGA